MRVLAAPPDSRAALLVLCRDCWVECTGLAVLAGKRGSFWHDMTLLHRCNRPHGACCVEHAVFDEQWCTSHG